LKKIREAESIDRRHGSHGVADRSTRALKRTWPLITVDKLVLSQEYQPQTHRSTRQVSRETGLTQSSVVRLSAAIFTWTFWSVRKVTCARSHEL